MRSHFTAIGTGVGIALCVIGAVALIGPKHVHINSDDDDGGVHVVNITNGDRGTFSRHDDDGEIEAKWRGEFAFAADARSLNSLENKLEVETKFNGDEKRAVFEKKGADIVVEFFDGGRQVSDSSAAETGAADLLQQFARSSGVNAEQRTKALIDEDGVDSAMRELDAIEIDRAAAAYVEAISSQAKLSPEQINALAKRIAALESDYSKRRAIVAILENQELSDQASSALLEAADKLESDHEIRLVIEAVGEKALSDDAFAFALGMLKRIDGDHETRLAAEALISNEHMSSERIAALVSAANAQVEGSYERRQLLETALEESTGAENVIAAVVSSLERFDGDHERRLAIEALVEEMRSDSEYWQAVIQATDEIESDYERRQAIEEIFDEMPDDEKLRAALKGAAQSIGSDHERRLALELFE